MRKLFLDDYRQPKDACYLGGSVRIYWEEGWDIVKDYNEFVSYVKRFGVPDLVSFDHDLDKQHYQVDFEDWDIFTADQLGLPETGLDCAKFLIEYCLDNGLDLPRCRVHSANPVGKNVIKNYLKQNNCYEK